VHYDSAYQCTVGAQMSEGDTLRRLLSVFPSGDLRDFYMHYEYIHVSRDQAKADAV